MESHGLAVHKLFVGAHSLVPLIFTKIGAIGNAPTPDSIYVSIPPERCYGSCHCGCHIGLEHSRVYWWSWCWCGCWGLAGMSVTPAWWHFSTIKFKDEMMVSPR